MDPLRETDTYWKTDVMTGFSFDDEEKAAANAKQLFAGAEGRRLPGNLATAPAYSVRHRPPLKQSETSAHTKPAEPILLNAPLPSRSYDKRISVIEEACAVCQRTITDSNFRCEGQNIFCTEKCWQDALKQTIIDMDFEGCSRFPLESFQSYNSRAFLLQEAAGTRNGSLIIKVVLHLKASLSKHCFMSILFENDVALNHYVSFLKQTGQTKKAAVLLNSRGFMDYAKMLTHRDLMTNVMDMVRSSPKSCVTSLKKFAMEELGADPMLAPQHAMVTQHCELLEEQIGMEERYKRPTLGASSEQAALPDTFVNLSLCDTIFYLVLLDGTGAQASNADRFKVKFKITDYQFRWAVAEPLVLLEKWKELDHIMFNQKWLSRKIETHLPTERLVLCLHSLAVPRDVLTKYLQLISDQESLFTLALSLKIYDVALKSCVKRRDITAMKELAREIPQNSQEWHLAQQYMNTPTNKWKD